MHPAIWRSHRTAARWYRRAWLTGRASLPFRRPGRRRRLAQVRLRPAARAIRHGHRRLICASPAAAARTGSAASAGSVAASRRPLWYRARLPLAAARSWSPSWRPCSWPRRDTSTSSCCDRDGRTSGFPQARFPWARTGRCLPCWCYWPYWRRSGPWRCNWRRPGCWRQAPQRISLNDLTYASPVSLF
ncbi:hypothetical protein ACVIM5_007686 [Bradyrhizobium sp. USDA 4512]